MGRTVDETGYPVSHSIYIDQLSFRSNGITAHEKIVGGDDLAEQSPGLLRCFSRFSVDKVIAAGLEQIHDSCFYKSF